MAGDPGSRPPAPDGRLRDPSGPPWEPRSFRAFFLDRRWFAWSILGTALILATTWCNVVLDVKIDAWSGGFYNPIQQALAKPGSVGFDEYLGHLFTFAHIAGLFVLACRKELDHGEDDHARAVAPTAVGLFVHVRRNYFRLFFHYLYFDVAKWSYLQFSVLVPYIAPGPAIVSGALTLGVMQQIIRAFGRVQESFQHLVTSWSTIVELISVCKRLRAFEARIRGPVALFP